MKNYCVTIPITGHVDIICSFDGEPNDDALETAALEQWDKMSDKQQRDCTTWEFTNPVCYGNVCSAECNEMSWSEVEYEPEEEEVPPTKAQLWRRVSRLAGELVMIDGALDPMWALKSGISALGAIQDLIHRFRMAGPSKREGRILIKLEAALAEYEAAP